MDTDPARTDPAHTASDADALAAIAVELADGAAAVVRAAHGAGTVGAKSTATDLVTDVDRRVEQWLVSELATRRPGDAVLGEEGGSRAGTEALAGSRVRWILDPIDGTVNFVLGIPQYGVSVAAEVDGTVVAGAVANPATGETFHARRGTGAFCNDPRFAKPVRLAGPRVVPLERAVVGTGFAYDSRMRAGQVEVVRALLPRVADIRRLGAAALDLCFLAAGRLDAYFEAGLHMWDHAAGGLIAAEAGCALSGLRGAPPSQRFYAAAGPALSPDFFALLEELDADEVSS